MKYLILLLSFFSIACNTTTDEVLVETPTDLTATVAYNQIAGIEPDLLSLDIYYNSLVDIKRPVVVWVHGGAWSIGDKANKLQDKIALFKELDYILVSINYRLSPTEPGNPDRIKYPVHNNDVADAIKWVADHIDEYGGDNNKMALMGHSAGAHLVSLTGTNSSFLENIGLNFSYIKGVAAIDTEGYDVREKVEEGNMVYINAFGTDTASNIDASPIHNILNGITYPKFFIAKRGTSSRIKVANRFIEALRANGTSVVEVDGSIYDHAGINEAIGQPNETVITNPLVEFFEACFN